MQANEQRVSAQVTLRELYGVARCLGCRQQDRRCHVEYKADRCLQCARGDVCLFERTVQRTGRSQDFSWNELIGGAEFAGAFDGGHSGRATPVEHLSSWRSPRESVNDSSAAHRPRWVDTAEQAGNMGLRHDQQLDKTSMTRASPNRGAAGQTRCDFADPNATIHAATPPSPAPASSSRFPPAYPAFFSSQVSRESRDYETYERPQADVNLALDIRSDQGRTNASLTSVSQHSRIDPKADKSYICRIPLCPRQFKGFSTFNDLQRHQKSAHGIQSKGPSATRDYKCFGSGCSKRDKEWPRLDNFKQHLIRMHKDEDVDELIAKSCAWYDSKKRRETAAQSMSPSQAPSDLNILHHVGSHPALVNEGEPRCSPELHLLPNMAGLRPSRPNQQNSHGSFASATDHAGPPGVADSTSQLAIDLSLADGYTLPGHVGPMDLPEHFRMLQFLRQNGGERYERLRDSTLVPFLPFSARAASPERESIADGSAPLILVHHDEPDPEKFWRRSDTRADKARKMEIQSRRGACDNCRSAKKQCDGNSPCRRCSEKNLECSRISYDARRRRKRTTVRGRAQSEPAAPSPESEGGPSMPPLPTRMDVEERPLESHEALS